MQGPEKDPSDELFANLPRSERRKVRSASAFNRRRTGVRVGVTKSTLAARKKKRRRK